MGSLRRAQLEDEVARAVALAARAVGVSPPVPGRHAELVEARRRACLAWRVVAFAGDEEERRRLIELGVARQRADTYLRDVLARLPFRWHVEHNSAVRETPTYGGADHLVVDEVVQIGRAFRRPGDTLSAPRVRFRGLHAVEDGRLPTARGDVLVAERIASRSVCI